MKWIGLAAILYPLGLLVPWAGATLRERLQLEAIPAVIFSGVGVFAIVAGGLISIFLLISFAVGFVTQGF